MRKKRFICRRLLTALLAAAVLTQSAVISAAANTQEAPQNQTDSQGLIPGFPWYDTNILGNLPSEPPAETEDFNAAVNYGWLSAQTGIPTGYVKYGAREEISESNKNNLLAILEEETHKRKDEKMASAIYRAALDTEARNQAGMTPVLPYINQVREIKAIDEMTAYLTSGEFHLESPFISDDVIANPTDTTKHMKLMSVDLGIGTGVDSFYDSRMAQAGIPKDEADTYIQKADQLLEIINEASASWMPDASSTAAMMLSMHCPYTMEELRQEFTAFPFADIIKSQGYDEGVTLSVPIFEDFKALDRYYTNENLEGLKGVLIEKILDSSAAFLDDESLSYYEAVNGSFSDDPRYKALSMTELLIAEPLGRIYADHYATEETKDDVTKMVNNIKLAFISQISSCDWLTEETQAKAMDKIRAIGVRVAVPDKWRDYSGLRLPSEEDGAVFADYAIAVKKYAAELDQKEFTAPADPELWPRGTSPLYSVWAAYTPLENAINIPAGILNGVFYQPEGTLEEHYFSLGAIIGHELTHSLDPTGSLFDKTGAPNDWWTEEDRAAYEKRQKKVEEYFSTIMVKPDEYVNGPMTIGEDVADIDGLSLLFEALKKEENIDYQKAFRAYAQLWPEVETSETASTLLTSDVHPPKYVRVNAVVQQFQEFHDAFDVKEGDPMYLAPEKRVGIWK